MTFSPVLASASRCFASVRERPDAGHRRLVRALRTAEPLYTGNTLYIDLWDDHLSTVTQILRASESVLMRPVLSAARTEPSGLTTAV
jgi:hypothetical protein